MCAPTQATVVPGVLLQGIALGLAALLLPPLATLAAPAAGVPADRIMVDFRLNVTYQLDFNGALTGAACDRPNTPVDAGPGPTLQPDPHNPPGMQFYAPDTEYAVCSASFDIPAATLHDFSTPSSVTYGAYTRLVDHPERPTIRSTLLVGDDRSWPLEFGRDETSADFYVGFSPGDRDSFPMGWTFRSQEPPLEDLAGATTPNTAELQTEMEDHRFFANIVSEEPVAISEAISSRPSASEDAWVYRSAVRIIIPDDYVSANATRPFNPNELMWGTTGDVHFLFQGSDGRPLRAERGLTVIDVLLPGGRRMASGDAVTVLADEVIVTYGPTTVPSVGEWLLVVETLGDPPLEPASDLRHLFSVLILLAPAVVATSTTVSAGGVPTIGRARERRGASLPFLSATAVYAATVVWVFTTGLFPTLSSWPPDTSQAVAVALLLSATAAFVAVHLARTRSTVAMLTDRVDEDARTREDAARRAAELEEALRSVSHDLKAPLLTLDFLSEEMKEEIQTADPQRLRETAEHVSSSVGGMWQLVDGLLAVSRVGHEQAPREAVRLDRVVDDVLALLAPQAKMRRARIEVQRPLPVLVANAAHVRQLLQNLLTNAIKYGADAGPRIAIRMVPVAEGGDGWRLEVEDNGPGIPSEHRERVFRLFERNPAEKRDIEGSGVGLALVRRVAESYGGTAHVEDGGLGGARFVVTFPGSFVVPPGLAG